MMDKFDSEPAFSTFHSYVVKEAELLFPLVRQKWKPQNPWFSAAVKGEI